MISLRYIDTDLDPSDVAMSFRELDYYVRPVTGRINVETLRYRRASHRKGKTMRRTLVISSDAFDRDFLWAWWGAERLFIYEGDYEADEIAEGDWIEVVVEEGEMPVDRVEDLDGFDELNVTMTDA